MTTELQIAGKRRRAEIFFDREFVMTDWDLVRYQVSAGVITKESALAKLKTYEPLRPADPREHNHWIDQQKLRLALLHEAKKSLLTDQTCESCGSRKVDELFTEHWSKLCLHCAEKERQEFSERSRGSCEFLSPTYNPRSRSWGLLYYWSYGREHTFIFWLADFFKTRQEAERAVSPINYYFEWLNAKYDGMLVEWLGFTRLLPLDDIMKLSLPMTPDQLREHLMTAIENDMEREHAMMSYYVHDAMKEHESAESD